MVFTVNPLAQTIEIFKYPHDISERDYARLILDLNGAAAKREFKGFSAYREPDNNLIIEITGYHPLSISPGRYILFTDNQIFDTGPLQIDGIISLYRREK